MMTMENILLICICIILTIIVILFFSRLFVYIVSLEEKINKQEELTENLMETLNEVMKEGYLRNDGRLKKFLIEKNNKPTFFNDNIFNESQDIEI